MSRLPLTEKECNGIIALYKWITADIHWSEKHTNKNWAISILPIENHQRKNLEVRITVNIELISKFSITLLLNNVYCVRSLDVNGSHSNKCSDQTKWITQTHKHTWIDSCPNGHAYTPVDITGSSLEDIFRQFCKECNIDFRGTFNPLIYSSPLPGI